MTSALKRIERTLDPRSIGVFSLGTMAVILILAYLYLVNASVLSVVGRKHAEESSSDIAAHVAGLEAEYFALSESVTMDEALAKGFSEPKDTLFASRSLDTRLTMR